MCQKSRFGTPRKLLAESPRGDSLRNHLAETPQGRYRRETPRGESLGYFSGPCPGGLPGCFIRDACLREGLSREEIPENPSQRTLLRESFPGNPSQGVFPRESFPGSLSQGVFPRESFPGNLSLGRIPLGKDSLRVVPPILSVDRLFFRQERPVFSAILGGRERGRGFWSSMWMSCWY